MPHKTGSRVAAKRASQALHKPATTPLAKTAGPGTAKPAAANSKVRSTFRKPGGLRAADYLTADGYIDVDKAHELVAMRDAFADGYDELSRFAHKGPSNGTYDAELKSLAGKPISAARLTQLTAKVEELKQLESALDAAIAPVDAVIAATGADSEHAHFSSQLTGLVSTSGSMRLFFAKLESTALGRGKARFSKTSSRSSKRAAPRFAQRTPRPRPFAPASNSFALK